MADPAADPTATAAPLALIEPVQEFLWIVIVGGIVSVGMKFVIHWHCNPITTDNVPVAFTVMSYGVGANDVV